MTESLLRNFTHITIPAEIWLRKDISLQAKCLWAELRSLHDKNKGGCYASDEYLEEFMGLKRSRLHEVFKELKDAGLMEATFNGRQSIRRAIVPEVEYQTGQQLSGKPDSRNPENRTSAFRKTGHLSYIENKEENKDIEAAAAAAAAMETNPAYSSTSISYTNNLGQTIEISESDIFQYFLNSIYSTQTILEAIQKLRETKEPIGNVFKLLDTICLRIDNKSSKVSKSIKIKTDIPKYEGPVGSVTDALKKIEEKDRLKNAKI